jgi:hypothetical protein
MTNVLYLDIILKIEISNKRMFIITMKEDVIGIHWYELLINHLVPSIYMFGLEEFCLNIECYLEDKNSEHLVDTVYNRFEQHIKNIEK